MSIAPLPRSRSDGALLFFVLACAWTWAFAAPLALAWLHHESPPPYAVGFAGLSAFGPLAAALLVAGPRKELRAVFGHWRASPLWILGALLTPMALHLLATLVLVAIGGHPDSWLHPPSKAEDVAALIVFPVGEEFGWRGFAQPRMVARFGAVRGSLVVGLVWGLWHLAYSVTPLAGAFDARVFAMTMVELPLYAVVIGWAFERTGRSMAVAIAFHAGAHLDHLEAAANADPRVHVAHLALVAVAAIFAARAMSKRGTPST
jgi:membrane protease YdiL (CAAX protease family)